MLQGQPPADRSAVVHHVHRVAGDAELLEEAVDEFAEAVEGVGERRAIRHVALAVAGVVRSDHVVAIRERGDQVAEHMRGCRKAVQQQHHGRILRPRLTIEDLDPIDGFGSMVA